MTDAYRTPAAQFLASQAGDMFVDTPPAVASNLHTFTGVLVRNPELRTAPAADGLHSTPIISLELRALHAHDKRTCLAQIPFTDATRSAAETWVKAHKKGIVVKVACDPLHTCLVLPRAQIINSYTPT